VNNEIPPLVAGLQGDQSSLAETNEGLSCWFLLPRNRFALLQAKVKIYGRTHRAMRKTLFLIAMAVECALNGLFYLFLQIAKYIHIFMLL